MIKIYFIDSFFFLYNKNMYSNHDAGIIEFLEMA